MRKKLIIIHLLVLLGVCLFYYCRIQNDGIVVTFPKISEPIDHIFVYPSNRLIEYECWIVDNPITQQASDHLPVVADVKIANYVSKKPC